MQILNCTVAIGGEPGMTVGKDRVTVPELLVLRAVHGEDAVRNVVVIADEDIESGEERTRLALIYNKPANIVRDVLGAQGPLPKTLKDTDFPEDFVISAKPAAKKPTPEQLLKAEAEAKAAAEAAAAAAAAPKADPLADVANAAAGKTK